MNNKGFHLQKTWLLGSKNKVFDGLGGPGRGTSVEACLISSAFRKRSSHWFGGHFIFEGGEALRFLGLKVFCGFWQILKPQQKPWGKNQGKTRGFPSSLAI